MTEQPEVMPHRSRKNTRRWCKGVTGREHKTDIRLNKHSAFLRERFGSGPSNTTCGVPSWSWNGAWRCHHERFCTICDKVLDHSLTEKECPDAPAG